MVLFDHVPASLIIIITLIIYLESAAAPLGGCVKIRHKDNEMQPHKNPMRIKCKSIRCQRYMSEIEGNIPSASHSKEGGGTRNDKKRRTGGSPVDFPRS